MASPSEMSPHNLPHHTLGLNSWLTRRHRLQPDQYDDGRDLAEASDEMTLAIAAARPTHALVITQRLQLSARRVRLEQAVESLAGSFRRSSARKRP